MRPRVQKSTITGSEVHFEISLVRRGASSGMMCFAIEAICARENNALQKKTPLKKGQEIVEGCKQKLF